MGIFSRKDFLKLTGLAGLAGTGVFTTGNQHRRHDNPFHPDHTQNFNMSRYAAPKLDRVRIGIIGIGNRGSGAVRRLSRIEGTEITALCDLIPEKVESALETLRVTDHTPDSYTGSEEEWKRMCEREDIDLVYICTPWHLHTPQAVFAMEHNKHGATELPAARTIEECWQLVKTSEQTRKHCMMLGNVCYDFLK